MDASLIGGLAALIALAASCSFLRQSFRARQVRLRLDYAREAEQSGLPAIGLGLAAWPGLPGRRPEPPEETAGEPRESAPIEPPKFLLCERRTGRMAPALLLSVSFHAAFVVTGPEALIWISRALEAEQPLVVRFDNVIRVPLTLRLPEARRVVVARRESPGLPRRPGPQPAASPRPRSLVEPSIPRLAEPVESLPAPAIPSAAEQINTPRPRRAYRTVAATTLLQPRRPAARREIVELPAFAAWTGKVPEVPSPQTVPGSSLPGMLTAAPPPRRPVLPFPSGLPVRAAAPSVEEPKLALPPPGVPVDVPPVGGPVLGSGVLTPGVPVSVISVSPVPLEPGQAVQIPEGTQAGGGLDDGRPGGSGARSGSPERTGTAGGAARTGSRGAVAGGAPEGSAVGRGTAGGGAPGGRGAAQAATGNGPGPGTRESSAGTGSAGSAGTGASSVGTGAGSGNGTGASGAASAGTRSGSPYVREVRLGGQLVRMEQWPDGTVVLIFPRDGKFDVVVVESAFPEALQDLAKRLSGRPVYTAYLDVGAGREWMLHYCVAEKRPEAQQNSMVVTLEDPPPLQAPYIQRAELPPAEEWKSGRYQVFHGHITAGGRLERVTAVRAGAGAGNLLKSFSRWEFRPATQKKAPVEIEVLLVIPPLPVP
ncbi:MAG: hypothetical protein ACOYX1_15460 [Acidobacteriota bacterium]